MQSQSRLLRLPREIRDHIVEYVFDDLNGDLITFKQSNKCSFRKISAPFDGLPGICNTSRLLYYEATPVFLSRVTPVLHHVESITYLRRWLETLPPRIGFQVIRRLKFKYFHGPEQIKGWELISRCPNLRHLNIRFTCESASFGSAGSAGYFETHFNNFTSSHGGLDSIIRLYDLEKLFEIPKLERLEFGSYDWRRRYGLGRTKQLCEWLSMWFQMHDRTVNVEGWQTFDDEDVAGDFLHY